MRTCVNEKIINLFNENRAFFDGKPITFDGIVDEETFHSAKHKILFLLKEVNYPDMKNDWEDFLFFLKKQAKEDKMYKTWPNVCLWTEVFKNPETSYCDCVDLYGNFDTKKLQKNMLDIAIVNIKKTAGGGSSNYDEILSAAEKYGHITLEEIDLINPEIVICGGTYNFARQICNVKENECFTLPCGAEYFIRNNTIFLQFIHPMWFSVNRNILFSYAKVVSNELHKTDLLKW